MVVNLICKHNYVEIKSVAPVIDFNQYRKSYKAIKTCKHCGKVFKVDIYLKRNGNIGNFCSRECLKKYNNKKYSKLATNKEYMDYENYYKDEIKRAAKYGLKRFYRKNYSYEDCIQECRIKLFMIFSRAKFNGTNPYDWKKSNIIFQLMHNLKQNEFEKKWDEHKTEEILFTGGDKTDNCNFENWLIEEPDYDKSLDIKNMLTRIYNLAEKYINVRIALETAYLMTSQRIDSDALTYILKKYNLTRAKWCTAVRNGIEHIYYNDMDNIREYIDISRVPKKYAFNSDDPKIRSSIYDKFTFDKILALYTGIRKCDWCGKEFIATKQQCLYEKAYCSKDCRRKATNKLNVESAKRRREASKSIKGV